MAAVEPQEQDEVVLETRSLDLRDYWLVVRRRWRLVVAMVILGGIAGAGYSVYTGPTYTATAQVVVAPVSQGPLNQPTQNTNLVNMSTEQAIAQSAPVIQRAAAQLAISVARLDAAASKRLSVSVPASTLTTSNVLEINWQAASPALAKEGADAFATSYLVYRQHELESQVAVLQKTLTAQTAALSAEIAKLSASLSKSSSTSTRRILNYRLTEVTNQNSTAQSQLAALATYNTSGGSFIPAVLPVKPSGFSRKVIVALGVMIGLLLGLALAFVFDLFDDRMRDAGQFEQRLGAATLGEMPAMGGAGETGRRRSAAKVQALPPITMASAPDSEAADSARALRATLGALASRHKMRVLLVVGVDTSVSADWVVAELGVALAESGRRVLVVASDLRGSVLPQIFGLSDNVGLSELLIKGGDAEVLTRRPRVASGVMLPDVVVERLSVLPSGQRTMLALSILDSVRMRDMLSGERERHDYVLLDAPPAAAADVLALAVHVDGVIVVGRAGYTVGRDIEAVRHRLEQVGVPIMGGVLIGRRRSSGGQRVSGRSEPAPSRQATDRPRAVPPPSGSWQQRPQRAAAPQTKPMPIVTDGQTRSASSGGIQKQTQ